MREGGILRVRQDLEGECGGEGGVAALGVAQEDAMGLEGVTREQETTGGEGEEVVGSFKDGWSGMTAFGATVANEYTGDIACDEALVEVGKELGEAPIGPALVV